MASVQRSAFEVPVVGPWNGNLPLPGDHARLILLLKGLCLAFTPHLDCDRVVEKHAGNELDLLHQLWRMHVMGISEDLDVVPAARPLSRPAQSVASRPLDIAGELEPAFLLEHLPHPDVHVLRNHSEPHPREALCNDAELQANDHNYVWRLIASGGRAGVPADSRDDSSKLSLPTQAFLKLIAGKEASSQQTAELKALDTETMLCTLEAVDAHVRYCKQNASQHELPRVSGNDDLEMLAMGVAAEVEAARGPSRRIRGSDDSLPWWWYVADRA